MSATPLEALVTRIRQDREEEEARFARRWVPKIQRAMRAQLRPFLTAWLPRHEVKFTDGMGMFFATVEGRHRALVIAPGDAYIVPRRSFSHQSARWLKRPFEAAFKPVFQLHDELCELGLQGEFNFTIEAT